MTDIYKDRRFKESPWEMSIQGSGGKTITVDTTWGTATFTSLSTALFEDPYGENDDISADALSGSTTASGQVITTASIDGSELTEGTMYRLEVTATMSEGNVENFWGEFKATR